MYNAWVGPLEMGACISAFRGTLREKVVKMLNMGWEPYEALWGTTNHPPFKNPVAKEMFPFFLIVSHPFKAGFLSVGISPETCLN